MIEEQKRLTTAVSASQRVQMHAHYTLPSHNRILTNNNCENSLGLLVLEESYVFINKYSVIDYHIGAYMERLSATPFAARHSRLLSNGR